MDVLTPEQRSRNMSAIRRRDTKPEVRLRKALWQAGVRGWRCDFRAAPGRPDLAFTRQRVAVFVDGTFWHGHPGAVRPTLSEYWRAKIVRNIERDRLANAQLLAAGWSVLRLWDVDVRRHLDACVQQVIDFLDRAPGGLTPMFDEPS